MRLQALLNMILILSIITMLILSCGSKEVKKAKQYIDAGMYEQAVELLQIEIKDDPKNPEAHYLLGVCYLNQRREGRAEEPFERAIMLDKGYRKNIGHGYYDAGLNLIDKGQIDDGFDYFRKAIRMDIDLKKPIAQKCYELGIETSKTTSDPEEVLPFFDASVEFDPGLKDNVARASYNIAEDLAEKGFGKSAVRYAETSVDISPDYIKGAAQVYHLVGKELYLKGDKERGRQLLFKALKMNPEYEKDDLCFYVQHIDNPTAEPTIEEMKEFTQEFPQCPVRSDVLYRLGWRYLGAGEREKAKEMFDKVVEEYPNSPQSSSAKQALENIEKGVIFFDDFEDGNADGWTVLRGSWSLGSGYQSKFSYGPTSSHDNRSLYPLQASYGTYTYYLKLTGPSYGDGDFFFQYANDRNYYWVSICPRGGDTNDRIDRVVNGQRTTLVQKRPTISRNQWHKVTINRSARGDIEVFLNDTLHLKANDNAITSPGNIIFRFWCQGSIDNVFVTSLASKKSLFQ